MKTIRIFVSSPGDVGREREITARVLKRLAAEWAGRADVQSYFWEHEPMRATHDFQQQIPKPSDFDIVVCALWSRLGSKLNRQHRRSDGSEYASGTEFEFEDAAESFKRSGVPDLLVYLNKTTPLIPLEPEDKHLELVAQYKALKQFMKRWFFEDGTSAFKAAFTGYSDLAEFEEKVENHLRKLISDRVQAVEGGRVNPLWTQGSPFRGLLAFGQDHELIFFGRTKATGEIIEMLRAKAQSPGDAAFVLLLGMSGCGKSSLAQAGVMPLLTRPGVVDGVGLWRKAVLRPANHADDLLAGLVQAMTAPEACPEIKSAGDERALAVNLAQSPDSLVPPVRMALAQAARETAAREKLAVAPQARLVLVLDQFEEMFTNEKISAMQREAFIAVINALAASGNVWCIATMRSDCWHYCEQSAGLRALVNRGGQFHLAGPTPSELAQIIREPARVAGLRFERDATTGLGLDEVLRDDCVAEPMSLPLLQAALEELYQSRQSDGTMTFAAYRAAGGLTGIISRRAEQAYEGLSAAGREALPKIFARLVTMSESRDGSSLQVVSRRASWDAGTADAGEREAVERFVSARLLVTDKLAEGGIVLSAAHEALARSWERLRVWIAEHENILRERARVAFAAARWREEDRAPDFLLPAGRSLENARSLLKRARDFLQPQEVEYIEASSQHEFQSHGRVRQRKRLQLAAAVVLLIVAVLGIGGMWHARVKAYELEDLRAQLQRATNDPMASEEIARRILRLSPRDSSAWESLARARLVAGDWERFNQICSDWERSVGVRTSERIAMQAEYAALTEDFQGAVDWWVLFRAQPDLSSEARQRALAGEVECLAALGRFDAVDRKCSEWLAVDNVTGRVQRCYARVQLRNWNGAMEDAAAAAKLDATHPDVKRIVPMTLRLRRQLSEIERLSDLLAKNQRDSKAYIGRAIRFIHAGQPGLAMEDVRQARVVSPQALTAQLLEYHLKQCLPTNGESRVSIRVNEQSRNNAFEAFQFTLVRSSEAFVKLAEYDEALATNKSPEDLAGRAVIFNDLGYAQLALKDCMAAKSGGDPAAGPVRERLVVETLRALVGVTPADRPPDLLEESLAEALADFPKNARVWFCNGVHLAQSGKLDEAEEALTRSLELRESPETYEMRANLLETAKKHEAAAEDRRKAAELRRKLPVPSQT